MLEAEGQTFGFVAFARGWPAARAAAKGRQGLRATGLDPLHPLAMLEAEGQTFGFVAFARGWPAARAAAKGRQGLRATGLADQG